LTIAEHAPAEIDLMDVYRNRKIVYFALDTQSYQQRLCAWKMITRISTPKRAFESGFTHKERHPWRSTLMISGFGTKAHPGAGAAVKAGLDNDILNPGRLEAIDPAYCQQVLEKYQYGFISA